MSEPQSNRSINVGGSVEGSILQTGDHNTASLKYTKTIVPDAASVDIAAELTALREMLVGLNAPDEGKIGRALDDADEELGNAEPDRDEIGSALQRALKYATKADGFAQQIGKIGKHVTNIVGWLGAGWGQLLELVHLTT